MPKVRKYIPEASLRIIGAEPCAEVYSWQEDGFVEVTGRVENLDEALLNASVVAAPSPLGGGILLKVLNAAALGCPVVTTPEASRALGLENHVRSAKNPDEFASVLCSLLSDRDSASRLGRSARQYVRETLTWERRSRSYVECYKDLAR